VAAKKKPIRPKPPLSRAQDSRIAKKKKVVKKPAAKKIVRKPYRPRIGSRVSVSLKRLTTLGVLDSIVGEMANVTVGCLGVWTKNEIVPLALVKKVTETESKLYDTFDRYMAECFHQGRKSFEADLAHKTESVPVSHEGALSLQVVERVEDVQVDDKSFKKDFVKVDGVNGLMEVLKAREDAAAQIQIGGVIPVPDFEF
jgi:hypothetical protein